MLICNSYTCPLNYIQFHIPEQNINAAQVCLHFYIDGSLRNEVLNLYLFRNLAEVREIVSQWRKRYNEDRLHDALGGLPPVVYA